MNQIEKLKEERESLIEEKEGLLSRYVHLSVTIM